MQIARRHLCPGEPGAAMQIIAQGQLVRGERPADRVGTVGEIAHRLDDVCNCVD